MSPDAVDVPIKDEMIRLGQFLKLANLVESGSDAKPVLADEQVSVNGEVETRRGRQLVAGDVVKNRIGELEFERDQLDSYVHQT